MPQPLSRPQPTSSVAAMLERGVGASVVAKLPPAPSATPSTATRPDVSSNPEPGTTPRQFLLSPAADRTLKQLQAIFAEATGLELRQSELLRAILFALRKMVPAVEREAARVGPLRRPKNGRGSEAQQTELEHQVAAVLAVACTQTGLGGDSSGGEIGPAGHR